MLRSLPQAEHDQLYFGCKEEASVKSLEGDLMQNVRRHKHNFDAAVKLVEDARKFSGRANVHEAPFQGLMESVLSQWREYTYNELVATPPRCLVVLLILDSETRKEKDKIDWLSR